MENNNYFCPVNDMGCPYYDCDTGLCSIGHPDEECEDYIFYNEEEE